MADAIASAAAGQLIELLKEQAVYHINLVRGAEKEVHSLAEQLITIKSVLNDAEKQRYKNDHVSIWLSKLESTSCEIEDFLDQWDYALLKHRFDVVSRKKKVWSQLVPSSCLCFKKLVVRHDIASKILDVKLQLDEIMKEKENFGFVISQPTDQPLPKSWRDSTSFAIKQVHGRDFDTDTLVTKLTGDDGGMRVVSIVGVGGLGKTTIAQAVYNDSRLENHFDLKIWVCVSDPFELAAIAKGIIENVTKEDSQGIASLETLWHRVMGFISGKKFLLVLDDVWTEDYGKWESLESYLRCGGEGSKILVTTRKTEVAKIMGTMDVDIHSPEMLSLEDCWMLMRSIARLGNDDQVEKFEFIGKEIAKKCHGLPLAAKTLGSLLCSKSKLEEWEFVLNNDVWKIHKVEVEIFRPLLLSYNELSTTLKHCFSYCAVFPKDSKIYVGELIRNWMAHGYLGNDINCIEDRGRQYFDILAMHSLFQEIQEDEIGEMHCKMHDIVHDFAQFFRKRSRGDATSTNKCTTCLDRGPSTISTVNEFRSLFWDNKESPPDLCECLTSLRVLSLSRCNLQRIPQIMETFIHLRLLNLDGNELSPSDLQIIFKLYNLKTLSLSWSSLKEIPTEIGNLIHLRHLDLSWNDSLKELPKTMLGLQELRMLNVESCTQLLRVPEILADMLISLSPVTKFKGGSAWSKLRLLKNLTRLGESVSLVIRLGGDKDLERVVEDAREAELKNKTHIKDLDITFEDEIDEKVDSSCGARIREDVMEALEPHSDLQVLWISNYKGSKLPGWMGSPLNQLRKVNLIKCHHLTALPSLGKLPCLNEIFIGQMEELEIIGRDFLGFHECSSSTGVVSFPNLTKLSFYSCGKWKEWEDIMAEEEASTAMSVMPRLEKLWIEDCDGLTALPHRLIRKVASSLKELDISGSMQLIQRYGNEDASDWKSISQNNPRIQLKTTW